MKKRLYTSFVLLVAFALVLSACGGGAASGGNNASGGEAAKKEVVLNIPNYKVGQNVGAKYFEGAVERFNEKFDGQYEIVIEEVPQDNYADKIKLLYQQNKLPPLVDSMADKHFLEEVIIPQGKFYDLKPWIDSKPELKKILIENSLDFNTKDGKVFTLPLATISPIGVYYNKEMLEKAGITKSIGQMNTEEFFQTLDQLKAAGYAPLSLMTGENAWTTMLLATAFLANEPGGAEILNSTERVFDYTGEAWIKTFEKVQKLLKDYTTENAIGAAYADAANNFLNERAAIIANGPWMVPDFSDTSKAPQGFDQKVGSSIYPNGVAVASTNSYTWWIPSTTPEDQIEAALAFLEFYYTPEELETAMITLGGNTPNLEASENFESQLNPIQLEINQSISNDLKTTVQSFEDIWPSGMSSEFGKFLPLLANGTLTPEQFAQELTKKAEQFKK